jgi:phospholipase/carboxylesterase
MVRVSLTARPALLAVLAACSAGGGGEARRGPAVEDPHGRGVLLVRPHAPAHPVNARGRQELRAGGHARGLLYVPAPRARPPGLLLVLHGSHGRAEQIIAPFEPAAERLGLILVAPESRGLTWDIIEDMAFGPDVAAIDDALEAVFDSHAIDGERVAVAGISDGASYALSLGVGNGQLFRAIIAFSPGFTSSTRVAGRPRVFISHGTRDTVLPIDRASRRIVPLLRRLGLEVRYVEFDGEHEVPDEILAAGLALVTPGRGRPGPRVTPAAAVRRGRTRRPAAR